MTCKHCNKTVHILTHIKDDNWACNICQWNFLNKSKEQGHIGETVKIKYYNKNNGNVPVTRIEMIKHRRICPDGRGEVVSINKFGKYTDRRTPNY